MKYEATFERPMAASLVLQFADGHTEPLSPEDLPKFGLASRDESNKALRSILAKSGLISDVGGLGEVLSSTVYRALAPGVDGAVSSAFGEYVSEALAQYVESAANGLRAVARSEVRQVLGSELASVIDSVYEASFKAPARDEPDPETPDNHLELSAQALGMVAQTLLGVEPLSRLNQAG